MTGVALKGPSSRNCQTASPVVAEPQLRTPARLTVYTRPSKTIGLEVPGDSLFDDHSTVGWLSPATSFKAATPPFEGTMASSGPTPVDGMLAPPSLKSQTVFPERGSNAITPAPELTSATVRSPSFPSAGLVQLAKRGLSNFQRLTPERTSRPA